MAKDKRFEFPITLYGALEEYNQVLTKGRCRIFYKGGNRNRTYITDEFAEDLITTLPYTPIKGIYDNTAEDYTDHGRQRYEGRVYGIVPENPNFAWESHLDEDGTIREYACVDVLLFTSIYKEASEIIGQAQSMELYAPSIKGDWKYINGKKFFVFTEGCFLGLQVLGSDVEPCFEGASFYTEQNFVERLENVLNKLEAYDLNILKDDEGGEKMDFKLSDNQKYNMIWSLLNSRFNEENDYIMDYAVCDVYDSYAVVFKFESGSYERAYYTKNDDTDSLTIDKMETCYIVDVNEEEKRALDVLHVMNNNTYEKIDEVVSGLQSDVENLQNDVESFNSKKEENETAIATLQQDKENLESELEEAKNNYTTSLETIESLKSENESLNSFKKDAELKEKEAVIDKYTTLLDEEQVNNFREKIDEFTKDELDKELAFVLVQTKSTIFTNADGDFIPKDEHTRTGIEAILEQYKNKKK